MTPHEVKKKIQVAAEEIGFAAIGVAKAHKSHHEEKLKSWLDQGYHASMKWMENHFEKRVDPTKLVPNAQTVIVFADAYKKRDDPGGKTIARYAQGLDYHVVLKNRIHRLFNQIKTWVPDVQGRVFVDSAPVLEHYWAEQAGVGWIGKNSLTITKEGGSFVYLGEIISTLALPPDEPSKNHCGTCMACLDACPTNAIVQPYIVDANKCIAYLTIEHKGPFNAEQKKMLGEHLFGCDDCLDACPWNHKINSFKPNEYGDQDPEEIAAMLDQQKTLPKESLKATPLARTGIQGLLRNHEAKKENC